MKFEYDVILKNNKNFHFYLSEKYSEDIWNKNIEINNIKDKWLLTAKINDKSKTINIIDFIIEDYYRNNGIGTNVLNSLFDYIFWLNEKNILKINKVIGELSYRDKIDGNWYISIPLYKKYVEKKRNSLYDLTFNIYDENKKIFLLNERNLNEYINNNDKGSFEYIINFHNEK